MFSINRQNRRNSDDSTEYATVTTPLDPPEPIPIIHQPQQQQQEDNAGGRRPIPVAVIDWENSRTTQFIPTSGLDFLAGVDKLFIQQTVELNDLLANVDSENRYTIKIARGDTLYLGSESSTNFQRFCFGSSRSFALRLYDQTNQESLHLRRRLAFGNCSFWCYLQIMEVLIPPGDLIGYIKQQWSVSTPIFLAFNQYGSVVYRIEGAPDACMCVSNGKDKHFKIFNPEGTTQLGSVNYQWDQVQTDYVMCVQFPSGRIEEKLKAILLGAAFLLEYMYFERSKITGCLKCSC